MKNKKFPTMIIAISIFFIIVLMGIINYAPEDSSPRITEGQVSPLETKKCEINLLPDNEITLRVNETYTLNAYNYQGSMDNVGWVSKNPLIVSFKQFRGDQVRLIAYNKGSTEVIVIDKSMGNDCTDYLFVSVEE